MARPSVVVMSESTVCRIGTAELLRRAGCHVVECGTTDQLAAASGVRPMDALVVDGDHTDSDCASYVRAIVDLVAHHHLVVLARAYRLAALGVTAIGVETPHADPAVLASAVRGRRPRASTELGRSLRPWSTITSRQREVLRWLAIGCDNRRIAQTLQVGERAVKAHVTALLSVFEVDNRTELALVAYRAGLRPSRRSL